MKRLIASAALLVASYFGLAIEVVSAEPNMSSSYSFVKGKGKLPSWKPYFYDGNNYVARDWNKDGRLDVLAFPSTHGWHDENATTFRHSPLVFLSNANSSYTVKKVPGTKINNHAAEWSGDFIAKGPIVVGNGYSGTVNPALIFKGLKSTPGPKFIWHASALADINNDGILDLAGFMAGTTIYLGNGKGGFYPGKRSRPGRNSHPGHGYEKGETLGAIAMHTGAHAGNFLDLDGDGYPEMITGVAWKPTPHQESAGGPNAAITVWKNNAGKSFTKIQRLPGLPPDVNRGPGVRVIILNDRDVIDWNECGDDCVESNIIRVYSTTGGKLRLKQKFETRGIGGGLGGVVRGQPPRLIDLNCDGHKDLATNHYKNYKGNLASQHGGIWLNRGNGTFRRLKTPIFANIPKSHLQGAVIPVYANADHLMDWIVIYEDGTFGTLVAKGGRNGICSRVSLIDPNGGYQKWKARKKYVIEWNPGNAGTYVKIQLFKKGKHYRWITKRTRNDGKHAWRVPPSIATSPAYKIKITSTKNKKLTDSSDNNFTIKK